MKLVQVVRVVLILGCLLGGQTVARVDAATRDAAALSNAGWWDAAVSHTSVMADAGQHEVGNRGSPLLDAASLYTAATSSAVAPEAARPVDQMAGPYVSSPNPALPDPTVDTGKVLTILISAFALFVSVFSLYQTQRS